MERFDGSEIWNEIVSRWGTIYHSELLLIAMKLSVHLNVKLSRDAKRNKSDLIQWFHDNWDKVKDLLDKVDFVYKE